MCDAPSIGAKLFALQFVPFALAFWYVGGGVWNLESADGIWKLMAGRHIHVIMKIRCGSGFGEGNEQIT